MAGTRAADVAAGAGAPEVGGTVVEEGTDTDGVPEPEDISDTRLVRRTLLRRKYGGEKASRGLAGRRRDGAVLQPRVWGEVDKRMTVNSDAQGPGGE